MFTIGNFICITCCNSILLNILFWFVCTSTELNFILRSTYKFFYILVATWCYLSYFEAILLRFMTIFIWKRLPPIDDQFAIMFFTLFNAFVSIFVSATRFMTEEDVAHDAQFIGIEKELALEPKLRAK